MQPFVNTGEPATIEVIGVDDSSWTVSGANQGYEGVVLDAGPQGLAEAPRNGIWQQSAFQEGSTFLGVTVEPIDLVLGFQIWGDEENWQDVSSRFRRAFDYTKQATLQVSTESGTRSLKVQLLEAPQRDQEKDPRLLHYSLEVYTFRAAWPYWEAEDEYVTHKFSSSSLRSVPSRGSSSFNALPRHVQGTLNLNKSATRYYTGSLTVENPCDTPLWPEWALTSPGSWGISDSSYMDDDMANRFIVTPTLSAGISIDTYPRNEPYVATDGSNIAGQFGGLLFLNPIPPHTEQTEVPFVYAGSSGGEITLRMRRWWNGPWGGE